MTNWECITTCMHELKDDDGINERQETVNPIYIYIYIYFNVGCFL